LDFKHSRLAAPRVRRFSRRTIWGTIISTALVLAIAFLILDARGRENELQLLDRELAGVQPEVKTAKETIDRVTFGQGFFKARPPLLECMRDITLSFGADEQVWVTNLTLRDNGKGELTGKAIDQRTFLNVLDRLNKNPRFENVQSGIWRASGNQKPEGSFSVAFTYVFSE